MTTSEPADAIVIGAGPNGLTAANLLADAGWKVLVLEDQDRPGGAVKSAELTLPGFVHDLFSAFYPLAVASPHLRGLHLERYGLRWARSPLVVAHPLPDGRSVVLSQDLAATGASLDQFARGDGEAWAQLYQLWARVRGPLLDGLFHPLPPVRPGIELALALRRDLTRFLRFLTLPVRRLVEEEFHGEGAGMLLSGIALHADLAPETPGSGIFGWLLASLGQQYGFPVPVGGAGQLSAALVRRLEARGGEVRCATQVVQVVIENGRAGGVVAADGRHYLARHGVLADVAAPELFGRLVGHQHLPERTVEDLKRFQLDNSTVKVDWALDGPIPWSAPEVGRAGTVHLAASLDHLTRVAADLATHTVPAHPYLVIGQMNAADPSRSPTGTTTAWAYTHVPQRTRADAGGELTGSWTDQETGTFADRMEQEIEAYAPGFRARIRARHLLSPPALEEMNRSLVGGALNGGTAQLYQQLIFRPAVGLARPATPIGGLFLASASAHPGGGVHGACGANAARAALAHRARARSLLAGGGVLAASGLWAASKAAQAAKAAQASRRP